MTKKSKNKPAGDDAFSRILDEGTGSKKENKPRKARSGKSKTLLLVLVIMLSLALLALGDFTGIHAIITVAGVVGIFCGASALYAAFAQVLNEVYGKTVMPL